MQIQNKVVAITGAANGIGLALARGFKQEGARGIALADLDGSKVAAVAQELGALGQRCDVARESDVQDFVQQAASAFGPIDLFCSNAGIALMDPDPRNAASASNADFERNWNIHVMAHVFAARALLPQMMQRGSGYFLNTVSAAGLGFAESLAITHRDQGIKVSVLCHRQCALP